MKSLRIVVLLGLVAVATVGFSVHSATSGEEDVVQAKVELATGRADAAARTSVRRPADDPWAPERLMIKQLREDAILRIQAIEAQIADLEPGDPGRDSLEKQIRDIKRATELQVLEIRLAVAQERGMTRHVREITEAIRCLREEDNGSRGKVVERRDEVRATSTTQPDQIKKKPVTK